MVLQSTGLSPERVALRESDGCFYPFFLERPCIRDDKPAKKQKVVTIREFCWANKVLPPEMPFTVIIKNTRAKEGRIRLTPLEDWLFEF